MHIHLGPESSFRRISQLAFSILFILFQVSSLVYSQDSKERIKTHVLELLVGDDTPVPVNFKIDKVIDKRENTSDTLSVWELKKKKEAYLINWRLSESVYNYVSRAFTSEHSSKSYDLLINSVRIFPKQINNGVAEISVSFQDKDDMLPLLTITTWESWTIITEPGEERYLLNSSLSKAMVSFHLFLASDRSHNPVSNLEDSQAKGFYLSRMDFINNNPFMDLPVKAETIKKRGKDTEWYTVKTQDESLYTENLGDLFFGYFDGNDLYYSTRNYNNTTTFSKAFYFDKDYIIFYHEKTPVDADLVAGSTAVGIIIGILTGYAIIPIFTSYEGIAIHDLRANIVYPGSLEEFRAQVRKNPNSPEVLKKISPVEFRRDPVYYWSNFLKLEN